MTQQLSLTLIAATVGFLAAIFFCIGNAFNSPQKIVLQATPFWDFNEHLARSLISQRVQYVVGAILLLASFCFQIAAAISSPTTPASLPKYLQDWPYLMLAVFSLTTAAAVALAWFLHKSTIRKVLEINRKQNEVDSNQ